MAVAVAEAVAVVEVAVKAVEIRSTKALWWSVDLAFTRTRAFLPNPTLTTAAIHRDGAGKPDASPWVKLAVFF